MIQVLSCLQPSLNAGKKSAWKVPRPRDLGIKFRTRRGRACYLCRVSFVFDASSTPSIHFSKPNPTNTPISKRSGPVTIGQSDHIFLLESHVSIHLCFLKPFCSALVLVVVVYFFVDYCVITPQRQTTTHPTADTHCKA